MKKLLFTLLLLPLICLSQSPCDEDVCVVEFNAGWNKANSVDWLNKLNDCGVQRVNIDEGDWQKKYNIVVYFEGGVNMLFVVKFERGFEAEDLESAHAELMEYLVDCVQEMNLNDFEFQNVLTQEENNETK